MIRQQHNWERSNEPIRSRAWCLRYFFQLQWARHDHCWFLPPSQSAKVVVRIHHNSESSRKDNQKVDEWKYDIRIMTSVMVQDSCIIGTALRLPRFQTKVRRRVALVAALPWKTTAVLRVAWRDHCWLLSPQFVDVTALQVRSIISSACNTPTRRWWPAAMQSATGCSRSAARAM